MLATDEADRLACQVDRRAGGQWKLFTNYGHYHVDLGAPGAQVVGITSKDQTDLWNGTSMAAPMVTGAMALVWGQHPRWDYKRVIRAVLETVRPSKHLRGRCRTGGVLDLEKALRWRPPTGD